MSVVRARERFAALTSLPLWPGIEATYEMYDEMAGDPTYYVDQLDQTCVDICHRLGLPVGLRHCGTCGREMGGEGEDGEECFTCIDYRLRQEDEAEALNRSWACLSVEEKERQAATMRFYLGGLITRPVQ